MKTTTPKTKTKKSNIIIIGCFYLNVLIAMCSCAFYAGAVEKQKQHEEMKAAAADILNFPDLTKPAKKNK